MENLQHMYLEKQIVNNKEKNIKMQHNSYHRTDWCEGVLPFCYGPWKTCRLPQEITCINNDNNHVLELQT